MQECYNLLQKHQISVSQEDVERVDTLRYMWLKLRAQVSEVQNTLLQVQPQFKATLLDNVQTFRQEVGSFISSYTTVSQGHNAIEWVYQQCVGGGWGVGEGECGMLLVNILSCVPRLICRVGQWCWGSPHAKQVTGWSSIR